MAAKKREIYARCAVQLRTNGRPHRAEKICPGAMGLYLYLLLDARGEQTFGDVAEVVALSSWSGSEVFRKKQAEALIAVGLIERRDDRLVVVKYDEHNDTPDDIASARKTARERKQRQRGHDDVTRDSPGGHAEVPISYSLSPSGSGSDLGGAGGAKPDWVDPAVEAVETNTGETFDRGVVWTTYQASRESRGQPTSAPDFRKFLGSWAANQKRDRVNARDRPSGALRGAEITKQPFDPNAPWLKVGA